MKTLQSKMIMLTVIILVFMAGLWLFLNNQHQLTIEKYNSILQRYMAMNELTNLSTEAVKQLNGYTNNPSKETEARFSYAVEKLERNYVELPTLINSGNKTTLLNFKNMIASLVETMKLSAKDTERQEKNSALTRLEEAIQVNKFVHEEMLSLLNQELNTYNDFYVRMIRQSADLRKLGFWSLGLASALLFLFSYQFVGSITRPVRTLAAAAREISAGNFDKPIEIKGRDELSLLTLTMNRMRISIKNLIEEMSIKAQLEKDLRDHKLLLKESELRSLQNQINPHFLFNTLNMLAKKAYLEGAEDTSELIASVSGLLRYNLRSLKGMVTLREELHVIQEYLIIQKARFGSRVGYELKLDESCFTVPIPCMTLQPFVENAIIHAIEPLEQGGTIRIEVTRQNEQVIIEIADDGGGMKEEQIAAFFHFRDHDPEESVTVGTTTGIGIPNVIRRLQLYCGADDVVQISSDKDKGTVIRLTLPQQGGNKG